MIFGILLFIATLFWFFYLIPLSCGLTPTSCRMRIDVVSWVGLFNFWMPLIVAIAAISYGCSRR